jgi:hypothetical protein
MTDRPNTPPEGNKPIIEPSNYSMGHFQSVRPGPQGYRQRTTGKSSSRSRKTTDSDSDGDLSNMWGEPLEQWTEEEREMLATLLDEMARKKRAAQGEDPAYDGGESVPEMAAHTLIATGRIGQVPVLLVVLPAIGSLFFGNAKAWGDSIALLAVGWMLFYITQLPWDAYETARLRTRVHLLKRNRKQLEKLQRQETMLFVSTFIAPFISVAIIGLLRNYIQALVHISPSSMLLYVLSTLIRPITHLTTILRRRAARLRRELTWSPHEADRLRLQLSDIEDQVAELRSLVVCEDEMNAIKEEVLSKVERAVRHVKAVARKEEHLRQKVAERVELVEDRVSHAEDWLMQQQSRQAQQNLLVRCIFEPVEVLKEITHVGRKGTNQPTSGVVGELGPSTDDPDSHSDVPLDKPRPIAMLEAHTS